MEHLDHQDTVMLQIIQRLEAQHEVMVRRLSELDPAMAKRLGTDVIKVSEEMVDGSYDLAGNS